jgi:hypothetical protein
MNVFKDLKQFANDFPQLTVILAMILVLGETSVCFGIAALLWNATHGQL